ncbi:hypothetical protein Tco_0339512 [Tanacetum coccineum]
MDDPNITTYGKIWYDKDIHNLISIETEFPAIVFNDTLTSKVELSCKPLVSPLNDNKINFRISFDKSDDEDYMVIYDKNSFSYKIISVNDLKMDSKNDDDKVNMPSFLSPKPESDKDNDDGEIDIIQSSGGINTAYPGDLKGNKSTTLVKYLQSGILAH